MNKSKKYFRRNKTYKKNKKYNKTHKRIRKSKMRKNKKLNKSKRYRFKGGGNFPYLPQDLVNAWWNSEHGINKMVNNFKGVYTGAGPLPTEQPHLLKTNSYHPSIPQLGIINESSDLQVSNMLQ